MLDLILGRSQTRRDFLRVGALAGLGLSLPQMLKANESRRSRDVNCILIWTLGGTSHHDTLDPKPDATPAIRGEFGTVPTAVPGVRFADVAPRLARDLNRFGVLRGHNPRNGSHGHADYIMMTGHRFNASVHYPCYGSVVSYHQGFKTRMPPFVQLGNNIDRRFGGGGAGIVGDVHSAFEILGDPSLERFSAGDLTLPAAINFDRQRRRQELFQTLDGLQRSLDSEPAGFATVDTHYRAALNLIAAPETRHAFDLNQENDRVRDAYGRNRLGQSLLLSRRLIESGVRFVTVTNGGWDTHADNFRSLKDRLMPPIDQGLPALLADLEQRGMIDSTLVVWLTDFGRTPQINGSAGRDHWATAGFAVMAGAGVPGGSVVGRTDAEGGRVTDAEYFADDIAPTIYAKLGIPLELMLRAPDGRPIRLNEGRPIREWM